MENIFEGDFVDAEPELLGTVTTLLNDARAGKVGASDRLWERVYSELRSEAGRALAGVGPGVLLQPTAVVNAACERLLDRGPIDAENRRHLFFLLGRAMQDVLVEHIRAESAKKRGGDHRRVALVDLPDDETGAWTVDLPSLRSALEELSRVDAASAEVVILKFFGGQSLRDTAELMGCSLATVRGALGLCQGLAPGLLGRCAPPTPGR